MMNATETIVVRDANDAHALIGRRIGDKLVSAILLAGAGTTLKSCGEPVRTLLRGQSVEIDALPPEWVHLDDLPGRTLVGETVPVYAVRSVKGYGPSWTLTSGGPYEPLTIDPSTHMVEVLAETPAPEPDTVSVREALAALVQALDGQHETYPIIGRKNDAMVKARAALAAEGDER